jgi:autoinducer 2 (AI-2) kinase
MPEHVLAIDAGTSGVRCLVSDLNGKVISISRREWTYQSPAETGPMGREFNPDVFWDIICRSIGDALKAAKIGARDVVCVSATSQREGAVFLDKAGKELYAGPNIDLRAITEGISIDHQFGDEVFAITGHAPSLLFVPARLRWFKANHPEVYRQIATVLTISDWIAFKLSGEKASDAGGASELGLFDIGRRHWSARLKELLALPDGIYPSLVPTGSPVGEVTHQAISETGLARGTVVVQGAPDSHCGLIGMGIQKRGEVGVILGWSAPALMLVERPILDHETGAWAGCYPLPQHWTLESSTGEAGNAYCWLKNIIFGEEDSAEIYRRMDALAAEVPPGAETVLAFIGPFLLNMRHLSMKLGGILFPLPFSASNIQRAHLVRAALENICFAIRAGCHQLERISRCQITEVKVGGSLAKSQCLAETLPSVLSIPILVPEVTEVSALGAAICAAAGSGAYRDLAEAMQAMTPRFRVLEPDRLTALEYAEYYQRWIDTAQWLDKLSEEMK